VLDQELSIMWWQAIVAVGGVVVVAALATLAVVRGWPGDRRPFQTRRSQAGRSETSPGATHPWQPPAAGPSVDQENLAEGLIGAYDLAAGSPAVREYVKQVLRGAGISLLTAEAGTVFDPAHHLAVDTQPAGSEEAGTIARVVRPGWVAGETLLRPAEVVVWTS
jgi:hypothetical protein